MFRQSGWLKVDAHGGVDAAQACVVARVDDSACGRGTIDAYFPRWYLHQVHGPEFAPWPFEFTAAVLNDIGEPRLICPRTGVDESFRMFWDPGRRDRRVWSVRIDRRGDVYELLAVESETQVIREWPVDEPELRTTELQRITEVISAEQWQQLQLYIDSAHLWHMAPTSPTRGCHGQEWTYELVSEHGYQVVNRQLSHLSTFRDAGVYVLTELLPSSARPDVSILGIDQPPLKYRPPGVEERTWWRWVLWRVGGEEV